MTRNPFAADGTATNPSPSKIEYPACDRCGSPNVSADAAARWDHQKQDWVTTTIFDKGHSCDDCEDECGIEWKEGNPEDWEPEEEKKEEVKQKCTNCYDNPQVAFCESCGKGMVL